MIKEEIRQRLSQRIIRTDRSDIRTASLLAEGDAATLVPPGEVAPLVDAAVLIALVEREDGPTVVLTQRTAHLAHHPGQISFPGGRAEISDDSPISTALRETEEEIGLPPERVEVLGRLDDYVTITGFRVVPVVGTVQPPLVLAADTFEVADIFEVPLSFILDASNHRRHFRVMPNGDKRHYYAIPFQGRYIWGATAGMLVNLCEVLGEACAF